MSNCVDQMGFAEAHGPVEKQRVIVLTRLIGNGETGGMGELVTGTHHEICEGIFGD